jgi:probable HAF family extracellular repeat protein
MRDLCPIGGYFSNACSINDAGQVEGNSSTTEGSSHVFITGADGTGMMKLNSLIDLPQG